MSYSSADIASGLVQPKVIENDVVVAPGLQTGELTLQEHQEYLVWLKLQRPLTRQAAIAAGHRPKEVYEYFGPLEPKLEAEPVLELKAEPKEVLMSLSKVEAFVSVVDNHADAVARGYTGDVCTDCGNFTMVHNGTCLVCVSCGRTTGCS